MKIIDLQLLFWAALTSDNIWAIQRRTPVTFGQPKYLVFPKNLPFFLGRPIVPL